MSLRLRVTDLNLKYIYVGWYTFMYRSVREICFGWLINILEVET